MSLHSAIVPPEGVWWKPAGRQEKVWIVIAFIWCMVLFAMMPFWHIRGGQNPSGIRTRVTPKEFAVRTQRFIDDYRVGEEGAPRASLTRWIPLPPPRPEQRARSARPAPATDPRPRGG